MEWLKNLLSHFIEDGKFQAAIAYSVAKILVIAVPVLSIYAEALQDILILVLVAMASSAVQQGLQSFRLGTEIMKKMEAQDE